MKRKVIRRLTVMAATVLAMLAFAAPAWAETFTVDRNDDPDPVTADGCSEDPNDCSLRGAIIASNVSADVDDITLPAGTYTLTGGHGTFETDPPTGDLDITQQVTITGAGARTTRVTGGPAPSFEDRIFDIKPGGTATITGLTITGGKTNDFGGGIYNQGHLTLDRAAVTGNTADLAGGIYSLQSTLNLINSTVSGNLATDEVGFGFGAVGSIAQDGGTANITNSTISGNRASLDYGGVTATTNARMNILNSTIASNTSGRLGGGIVSSGSGTFVFVKNTIIAANTLENCSAPSGGTIFSQGNSLSSDNSCDFAQPTDKQNTNPRLGPLQNNGGPTDTHTLLARSPAIDAGANAGCPTTDQRGVKRPQGPSCDVGAFERPNSPPVAKNDSYRGVEDKTLKVTTRGVFRNDTDADGDALRASVVTRPKKGKLSLKPNGAFSYKPARNFNGIVRFVYRASDGRGGSDTAVVTIRVKARPG